MLEMGVTLDFGQLVLDNEFAGMIKHVLNGIPVNDETLAGESDRESWVAMQDILLNIGLLEAEADIDIVFTNEFLP